VEKVFLNKFDWSELVRFDGSQYHDGWGTQHASILKCYEADALDYGVKNPFVEIPASALPTIVRVLRDVSPYVEEVEDLIESCHDEAFLWKLRRLNWSSESCAATRIACSTDLTANER